MKEHMTRKTTMAYLANASGIDRTSLHVLFFVQIKVYLPTCTTTTIKYKI